MDVSQFDLDLLGALDASGSDGTTDALSETVRRERRPGIMYSHGTTESALFRLETAGYVEQVAGIASYHDPGTPTPIAERHWDLTDEGLKVLHASR